MENSLLGHFLLGREAKSPLFHADVALAADDDMVEQVDAHHFGGLVDLAGYYDVGAAGCGVAGGVVVHDDDGRAVFADGGAEDLRDANFRRVDGALVNLVG